MTSSIYALTNSMDFSEKPAKTTFLLSAYLLNSFFMELSTQQLTYGQCINTIDPTMHKLNMLKDAHTSRKGIT